MTRYGTLSSKPEPENDGMQQLEGTFLIPSINTKAHRWRRVTAAAELSNEALELALSGGSPLALVPGSA